MNSTKKDPWISTLPPDAGVVIEKQAHGFFHEKLVEALSSLHVTVTTATEQYLVNLLATQATTDLNIEEPLALRLAHALDAGSAHERFVRVRETGDAALCLLGFWEEILVRRGVSRSYVVSLGSQAYSNTAQLSVPISDSSVVYLELAEEFEAVAYVLDEVRESTVYRTPQDILLLFERWKRTKSPSAARRLCSEGLFPGKLVRD